MIFSVFQKESVGTCDLLLVSENCWRFVFLNPVGIRNIIGFGNSSDGFLIDFVVYCKEPMGIGILLAFYNESLETRNPAGLYTADGTGDICGFRNRWNL